MNAATIFEAHHYDILSFLPFRNCMRVASASNAFRAHCRQTIKREDQIFEEELIKMFDEADDDDGDDNKLYYAVEWKQTISTVGRSQAG